MNLFGIHIYSYNPNLGRLTISPLIIYFVIFFMEVTLKWLKFLRIQKWSVKIVSQIFEIYSFLKISFLKTCDHVHYLVIFIKIFSKLCHMFPSKVIWPMFPKFSWLMVKLPLWFHALCWSYNLSFKYSNGDKWR